MTHRSNGRLRHGNRLRPSTRDTIALAAAVEERFVRVLNEWLRVKGIALAPPKSLDGDLYRWRLMRARHERGDFRNTEAELESLRTVAQWTVDVNCELKNQPAKKLEWRD